MRLGGTRYQAGPSLFIQKVRINTRSQDWEQKAKSIPPSKLGGLLASHRAWQETPFKQTQGAIHRVEVCPSLRGQSREQWIGSAPCIWAAMSNCAPHSMSRPTGPSAMWPDHSCIKRTSRVPSPWIWADLGDRIQQVSQVTFETGPKGTLTSSLVSWKAHSVDSPSWDNPSPRNQQLCCEKSSHVNRPCVVPPA